MTRPMLLLSLLTALGCQDAAGPAPAPEPESHPQDAAPRAEAVTLPVDSEGPAVPGSVVVVEQPLPVLIWGRDADGGAYTWWLEPEGRDEWDVIEAEGVYVADGQSLWQWSTQLEELPLGMDCELFDEGPEAAFGDTGRTGTGMRAQLERVGGDERITVVEPDHRMALDSADYSERVWLEGSVGPVLFVRRSAYEYSCGAHGGEAHTYLPFDAALREPVALYDTESITTLARRLGPAAWQVMQEDTPFAEGPDDLSLTAQRPVFGEDGGLAIEHQLTGSTCYACGDGRWDSYTTSAQVRDATLPDALTVHADYPAEAVRWLADQVEGLDVRGVSRPDPSLRPLFEAREVPGC